MLPKQETNSSGSRVCSGIVSFSDASSRSMAVSPSIEVCMFGGLHSPWFKTRLNPSRNSVLLSEFVPETEKAKSGYFLNLALFPTFKESAGSSRVEEAVSSSLLRWFPSGRKLEIWGLMA